MAQDPVGAFGLRWVSRRVAEPPPSTSTSSGRPSETGAVFERASWPRGQVRSVDGKPCASAIAGFASLLSGDRPIRNPQVARASSLAAFPRRFSPASRSAPARDLAHPRHESSSATWRNPARGLRRCPAHALRRIPRPPRMHGPYRNRCRFPHPFPT